MPYLATAFSQEVILQVNEMKKENVDLICSIGELAGLFEKSSNLKDFLIPWLALWLTI